MVFAKHLEIREHQGSVYSIAFDGQFIYSGSADQYVTRWNTVKGIQDKFAIKLDAAVYQITVHANHLFIGLATGDLHVIDLHEKKEIKHFTQHKKAIFAIHANPLANQLYVADADGNLSVWNLSTLEHLMYLPLDCGKIRAISHSNSGNTIALGGQDGIIRIFDCTTFNEVSTWKAHQDGVTSLVFDSASDEILYSGGKDALLKKWNWRDTECVKAIPAHNFAIYQLINFRDDVLLSCSRDKSIKAWTKELIPITKLAAKDGGHSHSVNSIIYIDVNRFASCSDDRRIILWSESNEQQDQSL